jgi:hypothetical protein
VSLHVQGTGHTRAVSPTPPGLSGHFPPYSTNKYRNHVAPSACNSKQFYCRRVQNASLQCAGSVLAAIQLSSSQPTAICTAHCLHRWAGSGRARVISPPKCTGYCKQAGGSRPTSEMQSTACQSGNTNASEGRHPTVDRYNNKSVFASAIFFKVIHST